MHAFKNFITMVWLIEKQLVRYIVMEVVICEEVWPNYTYLLLQTPSTCTDEALDELFKASWGWFENFKKKLSIHHFIKHSEALRVDMKAAEDYIKTFAGIIALEGYICQEVFNCDETGVFWKKMPRKTYLTREQKRMLGHKLMKDRLTLHCVPIWAAACLS